MIVNRSDKNPILSPLPEHNWESWAVFNASVVKYADEYIMLYRAIGDELTVDDKKLRMSVIGRAVGRDSLTFGDRTPFITPQQDWERFGCEDPRVTYLEGKYYIFYTAISAHPAGADSIKVAVAVSSDMKTIESRHLVTPFNAKAMTLFPEKVNGKYLVFFSVNTDRPPTYAVYALLDSIESLWSPDFWHGWYAKMHQYRLPLKRVNTDGVEIGTNPIKTDHGWIMGYSYIKHYLNPDVANGFRIEGLLLDLYEPWKIKGRVTTPLLIPEETYELEGTVPNIVFPEGALREGDNLTIYYGGADTCICAAVGSVNEFIGACEINTPTTIKCTKFAHNPLLEPIASHKWEDVGVFNPAAFELDGTIYIIYRAQSSDGASRLGLALSHDGVYIDERLPDPIYVGRGQAETPVKPGVGSGCEDPRVTVFGDTIYMLYTAYNGQIPRLALTRINKLDFLARNWSAWTPPLAISQPHEANKDGVLFPEKINDAFVLFHRVEPNVSIDFVKDLNFSEKGSLVNNPVAFPRNKSWDQIKIGINTPPIKTEAGWLTLYHGISQIDRQYRVGAMLFDLNMPDRLIARTPYPILEAEASFEKTGVVPNVVFPCGWVLQKSGDLLIYYGGADKVVCGARISLNELLDYLNRSRNKQYVSTMFQ